MALPNPKKAKKIVYDIQNIVKYYPGQKRPANDGISLKIYQGEIFGILGDNGSGKTTLVRQMMNLTKSTSGHIVLWEQLVGQDILHVPLNVGYMPQRIYALNTLKVEEALYYTSHLRGLSVEDARQEKERLLKLWQIDNISDQIGYNLSGGQRRLLQLAVAMAGTPPILILDEPTNELAPQRRRLVWDNLRQLNHEQGTTIIFITHDALEAEKVVQRVGILRDGKLVKEGYPYSLKKEINQSLRLELFFSPQNSPKLSADFTYHELEAGHWVVYLQREQVSNVLAMLDLSTIDDFRLYSATLEDLYLHYAVK